MVFVIIGTLIGAGFASGQEIYLFFFSYGLQGILGIVVTSLLIAGIIYKVLIIVKKQNINNYNEFLDKILPIKSKRKYLNLKFFINTIINLFVLITFFIMIAGFGTYFEEQWNINHIIGSSILACTCYLVFKKNVQGVIKVNRIIVPVLIIFVILIGIMTFKTTHENIPKIMPEEEGWLISSALYAGYNCILLIPVLITLKQILKDKSQILKTTIISGVITFLLGIIIFGILSNVGENIKNIEMPVAYVISKMPSLIQILYGIIIVLSIFTTSISLGNSFLNNIDKNRTLTTILMCVFAVLFSNIGFSNLITYAYPVFGVLGLIQFIPIFLLK